tara:strand:- start:1667 stop:1900 length:234 start_codon:yes stop_codon:yes gene_type:complete
MDASKGLLVLTPFEHITIVTLLLGILDDMDVLLVLAITAHVSKAMPEGRSQALEDSGQKEAFGRVEGLGIDIYEFVF